MLIWLFVTIILAMFGIAEILLNFSIPLIELRTILLFLLILGMSYRIYLMERGGEERQLRAKIRELEDKLREKE